MMPTLIFLNSRLAFVDKLQVGSRAGCWDLPVGRPLPRRPPTFQRFCRQPIAAPPNSACSAVAVGFCSLRFADSHQGNLAYVALVALRLSAFQKCTIFLRPFGIVAVGVLVCGRPRKTYRYSRWYLCTGGARLLANQIIRWAIDGFTASQGNGYG